MQGGFLLRPLNGLILFLLIILLILTPIVLIKKSSSPDQKPLSTIPITLLARKEGKIYHTNLEDYLIGVVAAEMPEKFAFEALKSQAVAGPDYRYRTFKTFWR